MEVFETFVNILFTVSFIGLAIVLIVDFISRRKRKNDSNILSDEENIKKE